MIGENRIDAFSLLESTKGKILGIVKNPPFQQGVCIAEYVS